jgi:hypothetical protein
MQPDKTPEVSNFLVAGHETISSGAVWALFALSKNTAAQTRLRTELLAVNTENPTMDELNALQYLDFVVRETLRLHAPVTQTGMQTILSVSYFCLSRRLARVATCDDIIPLSTPYVDAHGNVQDSFRSASFSWLPARYDCYLVQNIEGPARRDSNPGLESRHNDLGSRRHGI